MAGGANQNNVQPASSTAGAPGPMFGGMPQRQQPSVFQQSAGAYNAALGGTGAAMTFQPQDVRAGTVANTNLSPYMNPFTDSVINSSLADLDRARQMAVGQTGAAATTAGAFGGSRHGIAEAETNRAFADQAAQMASGLRQQGFQNAQGMAQFDIGNRLQAGISNQSAGLQGAQFRLGAAGQMGNLSQQGFGFGQTLNANTAQAGSQQQQLVQQIIDAAKSQYAGFTGAPQAGLAGTLQAVGMGNMGQQSQTTTSKPGIGNIVGGILGLFA